MKSTFPYLTKSMYDKIVEREAERIRNEVEKEKIQKELLETLKVDPSQLDEILENLKK